MELLLGGKRDCATAGREEFTEQFRVPWEHRSRLAVLSKLEAREMEDWFNEPPTAFFPLFFFP